MSDPTTALLGVEVEVTAGRGTYGLVVARGCTVGDSDGALLEALDAAIAEAKSRTDSEARIREVRDLFRFGKYKPTGRGKPASEYLLKVAREDRFPRINNLVDINNLISLQSMLPISLLDLKRCATDRFRIRHGREGEEYVFNAGGQTIGLQDLLLVSTLPEDEAGANAVKDSMRTKLDAAANDVLAVIYAPEGLADDAAAAAARMADALRDWGGAAEADHALLRANG